MEVNITSIKTSSNGLWQGDNPLHFAFPLLIVQATLVLVLSRLLSFILRPLRQPKVIAEIVWRREDYQKKRAAASANRRAQEDRCIYTGGSVPQSAHEEELARELGRQPTHLELFKRTKQSRKKDGNVDFARPHDQHIFDEYYKDMVEKYGDDPNTWPPVDESLWMKAAHTPSQQHPKPRVYGYGGSRDTTGFFPERRGSSQSQTQSSAHPRFWDSPEFVDWIRERVTIMFQELQRSGSHGVPSFTAQSSRQVLGGEDVGGEDRGSGREDVGSGSGSESGGNGSESGGSGGGE